MCVLNIAAFLCVCSTLAYGLEHTILGQLSGWSIESLNNDSRDSSAGIRYIPRVIVSQEFGVGSLVDTEISLNGYSTTGSHSDDTNANLKPYRLKLRYATPQTETQIGLQKINFGPALLLRPLRLFDSVDPRDPLQLTGGVYGLRFKYNTLNNASVWLWSLYGNDLKGYERLGSSESVPEFGGRIQYPALHGEVAATFHTRKADASSLAGKEFRENRFALDGRWDMMVGFWFESVFQHQDDFFLPNKWSKMTTVGTDYTFGIGNGLYVLGEHMAALSSDTVWENENDIQFSALNINYPVGYFDTVTAIAYYSWEDDKYYQFADWQRTYDNLIFHLSAFHYPVSNGGHSEMPDQNTMMSGYGGQITIIFNH